MRMRWPGYLMLPLIGAALCSCPSKPAKQANPPDAQPPAVTPTAAPDPVEPREAAYAATRRDPPATTWPAPEQRLQPLERSAVKLVKGQFNSSRACGACHEAIFDKWASSMHAMSYTDPTFLNAFYRAYYESQGTAGSLCLRCHAPTAQVTKDIYGTRDVTREGVTCDYCHSVKDMTASKTGEMGYNIDWSAKHGPYQQTNSPEHAVAFSQTFESSDFCAGCHDYVLPDGTVVFATYSEWKASRYAEEGVQCHNCHMPRIPGRTVRAEVNGNSHDVYNDHRLMGGHEPNQVQRAVTLRLESLTRNATRMHAVVSLENSGAGHFVPTGIPSRKLVLSVIATQRGRTIFQRDIVYQRVMQGEDSMPLKEDWAIKLRSKRVLRDNRIAPHEVRRETFVFNASQAEDVNLTAKLAYVYDPGNAANFHIELVVADLNRVLPRGL